MRDAGRHRYFHVEWLPPLLAEVSEREPPGTLADLGAGDGSTLYALLRRGRLPDPTYAVDISEERIELCKTISDRIVGIVADATTVPLPAGVVDAVVSSQVIEHLPDDRRLAPEIARLLRPGGWFYVSSVVRGPYAWWVYRRDGHWLVDPTHVREYTSERDFAAALAHPDLELREVRSEPLRFPAGDLLLRALVFARLIDAERLPTLYDAHPRLRALRAARVPVPGYRWVEAAGRRV